MKKIVVRVVTYNQEEVVKRALDSVLSQRDWGLYRLIVSDDCSQDRTWEVLLDYKKKYPDIMDIHRNEHNLGIYGNVEKADEYLPSDYDLFTEMAGDDALCDGYFESVQKLITKEGIDTNERIGIYSDWKSISPNGRENIYKQEAVLSGNRLWSLKARGKICDRSLIMSKRVKSSYEPILHGKGLSLTETHYNSQPHLIIEKAYYLPIITSIYYSGIGISTKLSDKKASDYFSLQSHETWSYCLENYVNNNYDYHYVNFELLKSDYYGSPSLSLFIRMLNHYTKGQLPKSKDSLKLAVKTFVQLASYGLKNRKKT